MEAVAQTKSEIVDPYQALESLLRQIVTSMVDKPDDVVVLPGRGDGFVHFQVQCEGRDVATLVGKRGVNAEAVRTVMSVAGAVRRIQVTLHVSERDGDVSRR